MALVRIGEVSREGGWTREPSMERVTGEKPEMNATIISVEHLKK